ncbi:MAG: SSS family solute:Na+ symporter [Candidatus Midichloriaceae bacterium]|jgi:SSS family solute:Na+ symporter
MNYYFLISFIFVLGISFFIGYRCSLGAKDSQDFFLANRKFGIFSISMSLLATQLGGGVILGTSDFSYEYGIYGIFYTFGLSLGLIAISIFGAKQLREKNIETIAELFEKEYNSPFLRKLASLISIGSLYGIFISLIIGSKKLLFSLGIENEFIFYMFWLCLILYTTIGGIKGVIYTDIFQILIVFIIFISVLIYYYISKYEYIDYALNNIFVLKQDSNISFFPYIIVPFLYVFIEQDMAQRFFSAKNSKTAYYSAFLAGCLLLLFSFIPLIFGIAARKEIGFIGNDSVLIMFFSKTSNQFISGVLGVAILCAIISTADSLLCAISSNLSLDFKKIFKNKILYSRVITVLFGCVALIIAKNFDNILKTMLFSYEIMVCTLFFPIVISYFKNKYEASFAYISIVIGLLAFLSYDYVMSMLSMQWNKNVFCLFATLFTFPIYMFYKGLLRR